jgi:hypothetical protein
MMLVKKRMNRFKRLSSDKRKEQLKAAQARLRAKRKKEGVKEQPFALSEDDHKNMDIIKNSIDHIKSKSAAISYALSKVVSDLKQK